MTDERKKLEDRAGQEVGVVGEIRIRTKELADGVAGVYFVLRTGGVDALEKLAEAASGPDLHKIARAFEEALIPFLRSVGPKSEEAIALHRRVLAVIEKCQPKGSD